MMKRLNGIVLWGFLTFLFTQSVWAGQNWSQWVDELRREAMAQGIDASLFDGIFDNMPEPHRKVLGLARSQPEHRLTYYQYRNSRVSKDRIVIGQKEFQRYQTQLETVGDEYGVDPCIITSLWGMETSYGRFMGSFPVVQSLATLAYDSNRPDFFRKELLYALRIVNDGHVSLARFKGEWAGASGQPQFLPSSWYRYAVDYNHDGRKDIWDTPVDVFASIANYLRQNGWQPGQPWSAEVQLPSGFDQSLVKSRTSKPLNEWLAMGVKPLSSNELPDGNAKAFLVHPDGGPVWLAFDNFRALLRYNNSIYYAGSIGYMADRICRR